jgi:hypothetical protein
LKPPTNNGANSRRGREISITEAARSLVSLISLIGFCRRASHTCATNRRDKCRMYDVRYITRRDGDGAGTESLIPRSGWTAAVPQRRISRTAAGR